MPQREVARMTGRTRTAVARIFTAFRDDNGRIHDAPHDVRPRSTTDEEDRWIVAAAVDQPFITARDIRGELGLNERGVAVMPWPPKGADMNPIENIWGNMKIQLSRRGLHSVTTDQLWDAVKEEWDRLRQCPELDFMTDFSGKRVLALAYTLVITCLHSFKVFAQRIFENIRAGEVLELAA
ncbi:hypothetical protein HPB47_016517 [Ixodes persulcatus]|uniref:Uncharacterized protein n=3 Tax=Ixodes persulcatus TaxID=34615 RepID=A0AC60QRN8_IXOPE|nr:hypothetical protein HPB47_016517 [Ixodes persulcatus]